MAVTLLLVEDLEIVRQGLRALLSAQDGYVIVGEAADGPEAIRLVTEKRPQVVLMDLHLPTMDGPEAIRQIKKNIPATKVIALTADEKDRMLFKSLNAGVDGYILKKANSDDLIRAIDAVLNGLTYLSPDISSQLVEQYRRTRSLTSAHMPDVLTDREEQVLNLVARGFGNKEIAERLCISPRTVEKHKASLKHKTNARTTAALVSFALENGLADQN